MGHIATACMLMLAAAPLAQADLVTPTAAYGSTQNTSARGAEHTINNSGLSSPYDLTVTHALGEDNVAWQTQNGSGIDGQWIAFNLGGAYNLTQANVWNYRQASFDGRAMKRIDVYVSSLATPVLPTYAISSPLTQGSLQTEAQVLALGGGDDWTKAIDNHILLRVSTAGQSEAVQSFALAQNNVQWVMIRVDGVAGTGNYDAAQARTGLFEVKFTGTVIPEPATLGMVGVIGIAMLLRRKIHG